MTEEEMDYQIELNELYSNKNDSVENLYEFTESELSGHDSEIREDAIRKFAIWLDEHGYMRKMDLNISRVDEALFEYEKEQKNEKND